MSNENIWREIAQSSNYLARNENDYAAWYHAADLLVQVNALREAYDCYKKAHDLNPEYFEQKIKYVKSLFQAGEYKEAANLHEYRWVSRGVSRNNIPDLPYWGGEKLGGKRLFVFTEQGRGDIIQFLRYMTVLKEYIDGDFFLLLMKDIECLLPLLKNKIDCYATYPEEGNYDIKTPGVSKAVSMISLLRFLPITADDAFVNAPYLFPAEDEVCRWRKIMDEKNNTHSKLKVGLVWSGNPDFENNHLRSLPLNAFLPLFELPDISWFSLQKGKAATEIETCKHPITDLAPLINTYADTAAIIKNLDLVITVDTSVLHLSGAVGCPTWALLHNTPDWRWVSGRDTSQWYRSLKLFRQTKEQSWCEPITNIKNALTQMLSGW